MTVTSVSKFAALVGLFCYYVSNTAKTVCDRDERSLMSVPLTVLFLSASAIRASTSEFVTILRLYIYIDRYIDIDIYA